MGGQQRSVRFEPTGHESITKRSFVVFPIEEGSNTRNAASDFWEFHLPVGEEKGAEKRGSEEKEKGLFKIPFNVWRASVAAGETSWLSVFTDTVFTISFPTETRR